MKKKLFIGLIVILVLGVMSGGFIWGIAKSNGNAKAELSQSVTPMIPLTLPEIVTRDLIATYGQNIVILKGPTEVGNITLTYWKDTYRLHATLWVDGLMVEVASAPLPTPTPTPNGG